MIDPAGLVGVTLAVSWTTPAWDTASVSEVVPGIAVPLNVSDEDGDAGAAIAPVPDPVQPTPTMAMLHATTNAIRSVIGCPPRVTDF